MSFQFDKTHGNEKNIQICRSIGYSQNQKTVEWKDDICRYKANSFTRPY